MKKYRTFDQIEESYFRKHPEEINGYIKLIFDEFAKGEDTGALLSSLRVLSLPINYLQFQPVINLLPLVKSVFQRNACASADFTLIGFVISGALV